MPIYFIIVQIYCNISLLELLCISVKAFSILFFAEALHLYRKTETIKFRNIFYVAISVINNLGYSNNCLIPLYFGDYWFIFKTACFS